MSHCAEHVVLDGRRATPLMPFTGTELRVIRWLPSSLSLTEIADRLGVSGATVKVTAIGIYRKLGVISRRDAVDLCDRLGLRPVPGTEALDSGG